MTQKEGGRLGGTGWMAGSEGDHAEAAGPGSDQPRSADSAGQTAQLA